MSWRFEVDRASMAIKCWSKIMMQSHKVHHFLDFFRLREFGTEEILDAIKEEKEEKKRKLVVDSCKI